MNLIKNTVIASLTCIFISSCLSTKNIDATKSFNLKPNEGIAIIGLDQGANALFWMGDFIDGKFKPDGVFPKGLSLVSGEPYIVQKAVATTNNRRYGMESINIGKDIFGYSCGQDLPVLSLKAGAVQYYGDFALEKKDGKLIVKHSFNIAKAQEYINQHYPDKHWVLENGEIITSKKADCIAPAGFPIIIYIRI